VYVSSTIFRRIANHAAAPTELLSGSSAFTLAMAATWSFAEHALPLLFHAINRAMYSLLVALGVSYKIAM
jgi:hypothetical protein